jgi:hypothetical protein
MLFSRKWFVTVYTPCISLLTRSFAIQILLVINMPVYGTSSQHISAHGVHHISFVFLVFAYIERMKFLKEYC